MKLIVVFADGQGHLRVEAVRAPEIRRREIAVETGSANLVACANPPTDVPLPDTLSRLACKLSGITVASEGGYTKVREVFTREVYFVPGMRRLRRGIFRLMRQFVRTAAIGTLARRFSVR